MFLLKKRKSSRNLFWSKWTSIEESRRGLILIGFLQKLIVNNEAAKNKQTIGSLIKSTMMLFHLSVQKETHGVSIKVTLKTIEMEYGIDFISKYTTLQINTTLD